LLQTYKSQSKCDINIKEQNSKNTDIMSSADLPVHGLNEAVKLMS